MAKTIGELAIKITAITTGFDKKMDAMGQSAVRTKKGIGQLSNAIGTGLKVAIAGATIAMTAFVAQTAKVGAAFEKEMSILGSIKGISKSSQEGAKQLGKLEEKARALGASTAYSATEATIGMQQLARAGLETNQVIGAIGPALQFAGASATSMESATTLLASTMKQFNLTSMDASRITDSFTIIQQKSLFDMQSLTDAMRYAGVVGASFGHTLEETTASVAMFRDLGLEGAQAGTTYRMAMMKLGKPTAEAGKTLKKYGIELSEVNPELNKFDAIARRLAKANMTFPEIATIFGTRASGAMSSILKQFGELEEGKTSYDDFMQAMEDGAGVTEKTYQATLENLSGFTDIAKSAVQELQLTIFETFAKPLMGLIGGEDGSGGLTGMINNISQAMSIASDQISADVGSALGQMMYLVDNNSEQIATNIASAIVSFAEGLANFIQWIPTLVRIAEILATLWVSVKLVQFIGFLSSALSVITALIPATAGLSVGLKAVGAAFVASNPIGWAVGLGLAVTALVAFSVGTSDAEKRQRQLEKSLKAVKKAQKEMTEQLQRGTKELHKNAKVAFSNVRLELDKRGDLTEAIESQLNQVERMTEAQLKEAKANGEVFETTLAGEKVFIRHATAEALARLEGEKYSHVLRDQQGALNSLQGTLKNAETGLDGLRSTQQGLNTINERAESGEYNRMERIMFMTQAINDNALAHQHLTGDSSRYEDASSAVSTAIDVQTARIEMATTAVDNYANAMALATTQADEFAARTKLKEERDEARKTKSKRSGGGGGRNIKKEKEEENKALVKYQRELFSALEAVDDNYFEGVARARDKEVEQVRDRYSKILELTKENTQERIDAERDMYASMAVVARKHEAEQAKGYAENTKDIQEQLIARTRNEIAEINKRNTELKEKEKELMESKLDTQAQARFTELEANIADEKAVMKRFAKGTEARKNALAIVMEERAEINRKFQDDQTALETQHQKNLTDIDRLASQERGDISQALIDEMIDRTNAGMERSRLQELDLEQKKQQDLFRERVKGLDNETALILAHAGNLKQQRTLVEMEMINEFVNIHGQYTDKVMALDDQILNTRNEKKKERLQQEREFYTELNSLEEQLAEVRVNTQGLSANARLKAERQILQQIEALHKKHEKVSLTTIIERLKKAIDDVKKAGGKLLAVGLFLIALGKGGEKAAEAIQAVKEKIDELKKAIMSMDLKALFGLALGAVIAFGKGAQKVFGAIGDAIGGMIDKAQEAFSFLTGGADLNPFSLISEGGAQISEAMSKGQEERDALDAQLASGEISQEEYDKAIASGVGEVDASKIGADFVQGVVDNAIQMIQAIASGAPAILMRLAEEIPILIDTLVENIPKLVETLATQLPVVVFALIDGIIELLPVLVNTLVEFLPVLVDGIVVLLTEKLPELLEVLTPLVVDLVGLIVQEVPKIVGAIVDALPDVVTFVVNAVKAILTGIPTIITTILEAVPQILTTLLGGVGDIIMAVFDAIPMIIKNVIVALPDILSALVRGLIGVIKQIASALPILIAEIVRLIPVLLESLILMVGDLVLAVIEAIPDIILALVMALPELISALIALTPQLVVSIIKQLPQIAVALVLAIFDVLFLKIPLIAIELVKAIFIGIKDGLMEFVEAIKDIFRSIAEIPEKVGNAVKEGASKVGDTFKEVFTLGFAETDTYGDTPYAIKAGAEGMTASFAPNDYVIASQTKQGLLKQSLQALGQSLGGLGDMVSGDGGMPSFIPAMSGGGGSTINLAVNADGRLLDEITVNALESGNAPQLERRLNRSSGARVGFDRGRFNNYSR